MNKQEFLFVLRENLQGLPQSDIEERLTFYQEIIEDRIEEGFSETEAVEAVGSVEKIVAQIVADTPFTKIAKERINPKRHLKLWEILLLAVGSPLWLSLGIAILAIIFALYIALWSVMITLWAIPISLFMCALGSFIAGIVFARNSATLTGIAMIATGLLCAGLSIFMFFGCKGATKGILILTKESALKLKNCFIRKGNSQ
jgi:uncharacterized membrane protein